MAKKQKINNLKVLFIHTHLLSWTKEFIKFFNLKKFDIIHTIRHPLAALSSQQKSWLNYKKGTNYFPKDLFYHLDTVVNCINNLKKLGKVNIIQLERLHTKNLIVMKNFCKKFQIKYENCLKISSKNNLKWWGDAVSARPLSGINTKHKVIINEKLFYNRDLVFFQNLTKEILKSYKYPFFFEKKNITFNFFPMKCEIIVWKNTLKNIFHNGFRWKHILSIPFFYILRILLINSIITNNRKPFLPKSL